MLRHSKKKTTDQENAPGAPAPDNTEKAQSPEAENQTPDAGVGAPAQQKTESAAPGADQDERRALEQELALARERYLRLLADFENARKRQLRERDETIKRANEELLHDLLPVLDHLELALALPSVQRDAPFTKGIQMVADQFVAVLHKYDVKPISALGELFDPERHEAVSQLPAADVPAGHVAHQLRRGWSLAGRLLRPAQVIVSSGASDGSDKTAPAVMPQDAPPEA